MWYCIGIVCTDENFDVVESLVLSQDNMSGHVKLNMGVIFRSGVLMLYSKISTPLEDTDHQSWCFLRHSVV